jgi:hypothetical protein
MLSLFLYNMLAVCNMKVIFINYLKCVKYIWHFGIWLYSHI